VRYAQVIRWIDRAGKERDGTRPAALSIFLTDPDVPIDTNELERDLRVIPMGRKNWLFCWSEVGAQYVAIFQSLIVSCRMNGVDPYRYRVDVLQRVADHPAADVEMLTPTNWKQHYATRLSLSLFLLQKSRCSLFYKNGNHRRCRRVTGSGRVQGTVLAQRKPVFV
jgi:hypothetical protein